MDGDATVKCSAGYGVLLILCDVLEISRENFISLL